MPPHTPIYIVVSIWHAPARDRTFLHGAFDDLVDAEAALDMVMRNRSYIEEEGYRLDPSTSHSFSDYIATLPRNIPVHDFVPTTE